MAATAASHVLQIVIKVVDKATAGLKQADDKLKKLGENTGRINGRMLGFGLSMLFTGMALKRFAEGALRSMGNTYMQLTDNTSLAHQKVMELQAGFEFLKFSIFDAIGNTDVFINMIDWLVDMFTTLSNFIQLHPQVAKYIAIFLGMSVVLGSVAMVLGQVSLLATGLGITLFPLIAILILIGATVVALYALWESDFTLMAKIIGTVIILLILVATSLALIGKTGAIALTWIKTSLMFLAKNPIVAVIIALAWLAITWYRVADAAGDFWAFGKMVLAGFGKALVLVGKGIYDWLILPLRLTIKAIEALANLLNISLPNSVKTAIDAFYKLDNIAEDVVYLSILGIDKELGIDKIREKIPNIENPLAFLGIRPFVSTETGLEAYSGADVTSEAESIKTDQQKQLESLDKLGGGASIKDLEAKQEESNSLLAELLEVQKVAEENQKEIKLTQETIDRLSDSMGDLLGEAFENVIADKVTIIPSTQG